MGDRRTTAKLLPRDEYREADPPAQGEVSVDNNLHACAVVECRKAPRTRGAKLCEMHYMRFRRTGFFEGAFPEPTGHCLQCGTTTTTLYCSHRCNCRYLRKEGPRTCRLCGKTKCGRADIQFCSSNCARISRRLAKYGLSAEDYSTLLDQQGNVCAACGHKPSSFFHLDHDHRTGAFRGILCDRCNPALGKLKDDPARAEALACYLLKAPPQLLQASVTTLTDCQLCLAPIERKSKKARYCSLACSRRSGVILSYGITPTQYRHLIRVQGEKCACCGDVLGEEPNIDHRHADGIVRGIVCFDCNLAAGLVLDDAQRARGLARYLQERMS